MAEQSIQEVELAQEREAILAEPARQRGSHLSRIFTNQRITGYILISPWFIGFLIWTLGPFLTSIGLSFLRWDMMGAPEYVGLDHFVKLFTDDVRFRAALINTPIYVAVSVPMKQIIALTIALILDQKLRGIYIYRSIFYLPSVTSGVATAVLWAQVFGYRMGVLNAVLSRIGIDPQPWLTSIRWALPTLIVVSLWNVGNIFVIYLAGLQGVPTHFYEAAEVDGATDWQKFWKITVPLITPSIFFNSVMGFISSFKVFTLARVMTNGRPADRTLFYVLYLYQKSFQDFRMGYASAMAWILFLIILLLTLSQLWLSKKWVYYEGAAPEGQRV